MSFHISFSGLIDYTDCGSNRCNSGGPSDFSYSSGRSGHAVPTFGLSTDLSGLTKVSSSPGTVTSHQRQSTSRSDRSIDSVQVDRQNSSSVYQYKVLFILIRVSLCQIDWKTCRVLLY